MIFSCFLLAVMISHGNLIYSLGQALVTFQVTSEVYTVRLLSLLALMFS